jgi:hypothetical protein
MVASAPHLRSPIAAQVSQVHTVGEEVGDGVGPGVGVWVGIGVGKRVGALALNDGVLLTYRKYRWSHSFPLMQVWLNWYLPAL